MRLNFFVTFEDESYCNIFADYTDFQFTKTQRKLKTISHRSDLKQPIICGIQPISSL